jgi:hypothetical protein
MTKVFLYAQKALGIKTYKESAKIISRFTASKAGTVEVFGLRGCGSGDQIGALAMKGFPVFLVEGAFSLLGSCCNECWVIA